MDVSLTSHALALLAGVLSMLSPCVLPLLPIVLTAANSEHRAGPMALALGLLLSFASIGTFVASAGWALGLDPAVLRQGGAVLLIAFGGVLVLPVLQARFALLANGLSNMGNGLLSRINTQSLLGQFMLGALLGLVWSPCVGPTLGAAITLASQGQQLGQVALTMAFFGLGAALPLLLLGLLSQRAMGRMRSQLAQAGQWGKPVLAGLLVIIGALILTGLDKSLEAFLVSHSPAWLGELSSRF